ncbi:MAG: DUF3267 domain-containing protein [Spirochaetales bacterium]|nr:DUF3267 domain-containing protein [Spirochaetales bacterium]
MENYYISLPEGYREAKVVDAKKGSTSALFTIFSFVLSALAAVPILLNCDFSAISLGFEDKQTLIAYIVMFIGMIAYIVLHELTHGMAYKALTHQKLTYGFTLTVAFCGVPDIYTSRKTALIALAAPFITFSVILIPVVIWLHSVSMVFYLAFGIIFVIHFGGCVGDLYMMYLLLFKYRDPRTLMNDTGPKQTIYIPE